MSLLNFNPPPLATPDSACAVQAPAQHDDDPLCADVFAQLVAAASLSKQPPAPASGDQSNGDVPSVTAPAAPADAARVDAAIALGAMPTALPILADTRHAQAAQPLEASTRNAVPRAGRIARATPIDVVNDATPRAATHASEPRSLAPQASLREQLAAALTPHAAAPQAPPGAAATTKDSSGQDPMSRSTVAAHTTASASSIAAAFVTAVERDRTPDHGAHEQASAIDAASAAATPSPAASARHAPPPAALTIDTPVGAPGFGEEVAAKLAHVVLRNERADLRVSPPDLGPVEIRIDVKNDTASLTIVAAQPATRDALEQALPQLREALAAQGIALGQTAVHDGHANHDRRSGDTPAGSPRTAIDDAAQPLLAGHVRLSDRLVDTFA